MNIKIRCQSRGDRFCVVPELLEPVGLARCIMKEQLCRNL